MARASPATSRRITGRWYFTGRHADLLAGVFWAFLGLFLLGVALILGAIFLGGYAGAWTFLYPLPTMSGGPWGAGAAIAFLLGYTSIGIGFLLLHLEVMRKLIAACGGGMGGSADLSARRAARMPGNGGNQNMTIAETVAHSARYAAGKDATLRADPLGFAHSAMKGGAYVGIGIILIFILGQTADPSWRNRVMGAAFGIGLTLVILAGSDLFTGHAMYGAQGWLSGTLGAGGVLRLWAAHSN